MAVTKTRNQASGTFMPIAKAGSERVRRASFAGDRAAPDRAPKLSLPAADDLATGGLR